MMRLEVMPIRRQIGNFVYKYVKDFFLIVIINEHFLFQKSILWNSTEYLFYFHKLFHFHTDNFDLYVCCFCTRNLERCGTPYVHLSFWAVHSRGANIYFTTINIIYLHGTEFITDSMISAMSTADGLKLLFRNWKSNTIVGTFVFKIVVELLGYFTDAIK